MDRIHRQLQKELRDRKAQTPKATNAVTLLSCPFCESEAISEDHDDNGWYVGCGNDDCDLRPNFWGKDKREAEATWNFRKCKAVLSDLLAGKTFDVAYVDGVEGPSLYVNDYRICGPKPWGGGNVLKRWKARGEDIAAALGLGK